MTVICRLVNDLQLKDKVLFLGKQDNLEELYSISDLMLLLSEKESFGLVALEAMACGVPCIGTNTGGIPEVISDGETGYICTLGDITDISKKAIKLLNDEPLLERFASQSISLAKGRFSASQIVIQYEEFYYELLEKGDLR
jgi:glycosyltransferase involved in cell wall biosynthesis